jgi:hypothetical protein
MRTFERHAYNGRGASFRQPVALAHGHVERRLRPLLNLGLERGTARDARLQTPAEHGLYFLKVSKESYFRGKRNLLYADF